MSKIKSILISQPQPAESSPYLELAKKEKIEIDFRPFIYVQGADAKDLRTQKIDLSKYTGIIFTSRNAIDHYFRLAEEMRFSVPDSMRYICQSEAIANYLQKHIVYRKRKISFGEKLPTDIIPLLKKYPSEKYLLPSSDILNDGITKVLDESGVDWTRAIMYRTVNSDLSDININGYDVLVFFSPQGIKSLVENFKDYKKSKFKVAVFGNSTKAEAEKAGLTVDIMAPTKENPSMTMALENFIKKANK
ncbi:uroporphyrinogen-III synthase [Riemerella anatipestifer]|nr:uroporphyrinogen-III synthase [Riemerella anatipestifer]MDY3357888.1 uroporphyrinogen-III synthase [Riemerella anatipestifer]